jgi:hypothetical protein
MLIDFELSRLSVTSHVGLMRKDSILPVLKGMML